MNNEVALTIWTSISIRDGMLEWELFVKPIHSGVHLSFVSSHPLSCKRAGATNQFRCNYARFTLADPMPRLGSDVVGGNSGRNHPTSRRHTIHIGRMARNVSIRVGWYERVVQYCTTPWLVR